MSKNVQPKHKHHCSKCRYLCSVTSMFDSYYDIYCCLDEELNRIFVWRYGDGEDEFRQETRSGLRVCLDNASSPLYAVLEYLLTQHVTTD